MLEEITIENEYGNNNTEPSDDLKKGVKETINLAKAWFYLEVLYESKRRKCNKRDEKYLINN